jgi:hypothetical protein
MPAFHLHKNLTLLQQGSNKALAGRSVLLVCFVSNGENAMLRKTFLPQRKISRLLWVVGVLVIFMLLILAACTYGCPATTPCPPCATEPPSGTCAGGTRFDDLVVGSQVNVVDTFTSSSLTIYALPFQWTNGSWTSNGFAEVRDDMPSGTDNAMFLNNANLGFNLNASCIYITYCDMGGNINFIANGSEIAVPDMTDLNSVNIPGLTLNATPDAVNQECGVLEIKGTLELQQFQETKEMYQITFAVGGQELFIDDVCPCP